MLRRHLLASLAAATLVVGALPASAKTLDEIIADGVIRIGINPNFPNMSVRNDAGEWEGFDIDVGKHGDTGTSELEVVKALVERKADAGFVGDATWAKLLAEGQVDRGVMQAVWTSPGFDHCNFTALPPLAAGPLAGITRELLLEWTPVVERDLTLEEALGADEVFLTSSLRDVQLVERWDGHAFTGLGAVTAQLAGVFAERSGADLDP